MKIDKSLSSKENVVDFGILSNVRVKQNIFEKPLYPSFGPDLGAKDDKRSVKMCPTNFYKRFFKNILL